MQTEHQENNSAASLPSAGRGKESVPRVLKILTALLIVMFPVGFLIMFTDAGRPFLWTTTVFLFLQALITFILLLQVADTLSVIISSAVIFTASYFVEWWGVNTGFPFGLYSYSGVLAPVINGVPLAISFAWFVVTANSLLAAKYLLRLPGSAAIMVSAVLILATDILLEPFAAFINNYWQWAGGAIPIRNFISWFILGLLFSFALNYLVKWNVKDSVNRKLMLISALIIIINILNFSVVNIAGGYYVLTLTGITMFAVILILSYLFRGKIQPGRSNV